MTAKIPLFNECLLLRQADQDEDLCYTTDLCASILLHTLKCALFFVTAKNNLAIYFAITHSISVSDETQTIPEDTLQCLQGIGGSCSGLKHLLRPGYCTLETLAKCYIGQMKGITCIANT